LRHQFADGLARIMRDVCRSPRLRPKICVTFSLRVGRAYESEQASASREWELRMRGATTH